MNDGMQIGLDAPFRGQSVPRSDECVLSNEFIDEAIRRYAPCFQFARYIEREVLRQVQTTATLKLEDAERTIADLRIRFDETKEELSNARAENVTLMQDADDLRAVLAATKEQLETARIKGGEQARRAEALEGEVIVLRDRVTSRMKGVTVQHDSSGRTVVIRVYRDGKHIWSYVEP